MDAPLQSRRGPPRWQVIVTFVAVLIDMFWGGTVLRNWFPWMSPGLVFCLQTASAFAIFILINSIASFVTDRSGGTAGEEPRGQLLGAVSGLIFLACWCVFIASWFVLAYVETNALSQPDHLSGVYTVARHLKSVVRYLTPEQAMLDDIAHWSLIGSWVTGATVIIVRILIRRRRRSGMDLRQ